MGKFKANTDELEKGFARLGRTLNTMSTTSGDLGKMTVEIGLPDDRIHNPSKLTLAEVGAIHEFGLGNVPERSFLRGAVMTARNDIKGKFKIATGKVVDGSLKPIVAMEQIALWGQGMVQEYMKNGKSHFAPLDQATIKRRKKKSDNPLNDTGELIQGVIGVVVSD